MTESQTRSALLTGAFVAAFIVAVYIVGTLYQFLFTTAAYSEELSVGLYAARNAGLDAIIQVVGVILRAAVFGAGVFVSLRWVAPIEAGAPWKRVILRGVIATALGSAAALVLAILEGVVNAFGTGLHPLGYALDPSFSVANAHNGLINAFGGVLSPFLEWLPLVVLATVLLRVWLAQQDKRETQPARETELR